MGSTQGIFVYLNNTRLGIYLSNKQQYDDGVREHLISILDEDIKNNGSVVTGPVVKKDSSNVYFVKTNKNK